MAEASRASPVDEGSSSARQEIDRAAQDQRGADEKGKTGLEPNSAQTPPIDAAERIEARQARRASMLQRFMRAAHFTLWPIIPFRRSGKATGKGKGRASGGGSAYRARTAQNRSAKRSATLHKLIPPMSKAASPHLTAPRPPRPPPTPRPPRLWRVAPPKV